MESLIESLVEDRGFDVEDLEDLYEFCQEFIEEFETVTERAASKRFGNFVKGQIKRMGSGKDPKDAVRGGNGARSAYMKAARERRIAARG